MCKRCIATQEDKRAGVYSHYTSFHLVLDESYERRIAMKEKDYEMTDKERDNKMETRIEI